MKELKDFGTVLSMDIHNTVKRTMASTATLAEFKAKAKFGHYQPGWKELSDATLWEHSIYFGARGGSPTGTSDSPLLLTGELRDSVQSSSDDMSAEVGTDNPKMPVHELGDGSTPARPVFGPLIDEMEPFMQGLVDDAVLLEMGEK